MSRKPHPRRPPASKRAPASAPPHVPSFDLVPVRPRHDGWTPERQTGFIRALAESGCVVSACAAVGMAEEGAYRLRARPDALSFRNAWDSALDYAVRRLSDRAFSRAINGVAVPVFFQGEQIGERRYYDERLTMFILRYRDPLRYGKWRDRQEQPGIAESAAARLHMGLADTGADALLSPAERAAANRRHAQALIRTLRQAHGEPWEEEEEEQPDDDWGCEGEGDVV